MGGSLGLGSDRDLQDEVIAALADPRIRASAEWRRRRLADPDRLERFSRFLARRFYHERVVHFFRYSRSLARVTGRRPEEVVRGPEFDALLPEVVLGSRRTAAAVAGLIVREQRRGAHERLPYFTDLLRYQETMMVVEAGPRDWTRGVESREPAPGALVETVEGVVVLELQHDLPKILPALLAPWREPPQPPRRSVRLVVARTPQGRVSVLKANETVVGLLREGDRPRAMEDLAADVGVDPSALAPVLDELAAAGAVRFSTGS